MTEAKGVLRNKETGLKIPGRLIPFSEIRLNDGWMGFKIDGDPYGVRSFQQAGWDFIPEPPTETNLPTGTIAIHADGRTGILARRLESGDWKAVETGFKILDMDMAKYIAEVGNWAGYYKVIYNPEDK